MKIAFVAPPFGQTGGPEITTTQLVDALVEQGADVTFFAPGDWRTKAKLIPTIERSLWSMPDFNVQTVQERRNLIVASQVKILSYQDEFDIIQLNSQRYAYAVGSNLHVPCVLTLNNRINKKLHSFIKGTGIHTVSFTAKYQNEIGADFYSKRGIPLDYIKPRFLKGNGLLTVGRITDQKGIHLAIEISKKANKKLTIVGRIGDSDERKEYYKEKIKPHIDGEQIIHIEKMENSKVLDFMAGSEALLFPIIRPEAFGRVQLEALACGTPVIGTKVDPLPEILCDKKVAFLSDDVEEMAWAASNTQLFDRLACREFVEKNRDIRKEAQGYMKIYENILEKSV